MVQGVHPNAKRAAYMRTIKLKNVVAIETDEKSHEK